jgi:TMEM175 potassium channel family protein
MGKGRLEAFSDGVLAIIITIMVLEMNAPHTADINALRPLLPVFLSYLLSFIYLGIYWTNHHHMVHSIQRVSGGILWANLHLLFWLSLVPFTTAWMGENSFAAAPTALYGLNLLLAAIAYWNLQRTIIARQGRGSLLAAAVGRDVKSKLSLALYVIAIAATTVAPWIEWVIFVAVALTWLIPDRRIERTLAERINQE